jgi:hypothetical protein
MIYWYRDRDRCCNSSNTRPLNQYAEPVVAEVAKQAVLTEYSKRLRFNC